MPGGVQVGVQGTHLIRASINPSGRPPGRVLTQTTAQPVSVTSGGANTSTIQVTQSMQATPQVSQIAGQATSNAQILATVQCPRPQTATLVYSNVSNHNAGQPFGATGTAGGQRLTLSHSRPIRPIQLTATNNRITGTGLRTANISIRPPANVPGLTTANVLTATLPGQGMGQQQQGGPNQGQQQQQQQQRTVGSATVAGIVGGTGTGTANLATRIIQVQAPQTGGTAQVINTGRISGNLMTLTPVLSSVSGVGGAVGRNTVTGGGGIGGAGGGGPVGGKIQPSLTITHVGKFNQGPQQQQQQQQGVQVTGNNTGGHIVVSQAPQQPQTMIVTMGGNQNNTALQVGGPMTTTTTTIVGQAQQQQQSQQHHQMMNVVSQPTAVSSTMLPLTTTVGGGRPGATGIVRTLTTSQASGLQGSIVPASTGTTLLPLAKVMSQGSGNTGQTIVETQLQQAQQAGSIFIHSRSPNPMQVTGGGGGAGVGHGNQHGNSGILTLAAATASQSLGNIITGVPYSVQNTLAGGNAVTSMGNNSGSSFAVVTNRGTSLQGVVPVAATMTNTGSGHGVSGGSSGQTHQIITMTQAQQQNSAAPQQQHIMIPVGTTTAKVAGTIGQSPRPSILRKRDNEGGIVLTANSSTTVTANSSSSSSSTAGVTVMTNQTVRGGASSPQIVKGVKNLVPILHAIGTLANSGATGGNSSGAGSGSNVVMSSTTSAKMEIIAKERSSGMYVSPPAVSPSDGSTTVSATSSPGVDKQQQQLEQRQQENELNSTALTLKLQSELKRVRGKEKELSGRSREPSPRKKMKKT